MAQQIYGMKTLNDNWFEDRCAPPGELTALGNISEKACRPVETDLAYLGKTYHPLTRIARMPPRPSHALLDDGFNVKQTTTQVDFAHPRRYGTPRGSTAPTIITTANAPVCPPEQRELPGPKYGFGAALPRHPENHEQRFWNTTNCDFYGEGGPRSARTGRMPAIPSASSHAAGWSTERMERKSKMEGIKVGKLVGESYVDTTDPATSTNTQRMWLYCPDAALTNVHLGGSKPRIQGPDNELSLPLGEGEMTKIRAALASRNGKLARTSTTITTGSHHGNQRSGIRIFQDA